MWDGCALGALGRLRGRGDAQICVGYTLIRFKEPFVMRAYGERGCSR